MELTNKISKVYIVGGLLFGDEGKGTTVEYLANETKAKLVVRFGGGSQAAHHIVLQNGIWHCFSQFGAGSFLPGCRTLLGKYMFISPHTMKNEEKVLLDKGQIDILNRLHIDNDCFIITPYHKLLNRICEILKGGKMHGSTGQGVGATSDDAYRAYPDHFPLGDIFLNKTKNNQVNTCLQIKDLADKTLLFSKLNKLVLEKIKEVKSLIKKFDTGNESEIFDKHYYNIVQSDKDKLIEDKKKILDECNNLLVSSMKEYTTKALQEFYLKFAEQYKQTFVNGLDIINTELEAKNDIIFEGAQGCILDKIYGIYPHLTKSLCSDENALALLKDSNHKYKVIKIGVVRAYSSRHGSGPFLTYSKTFTDKIKEEHNTTGKWQGKFLLGPFDSLLVNYGIKIFKPDYLSITCIDKIVSASRNCKEIKELPICFSYLIKKPISNDLLKIIQNDKLFRIEEDEFTFTIKEVLKREPEDSFYSLDLLAVFKNSECVINTKNDYNDYNNDIKNNKNKEKIDSGIKNKLKLDSNMSEDLSRFLLKIEENSSIPIAILSVGPTKEDKICVDYNIFN